MFTKKMRMNEKRVRIIKKWLKSTIFRKLQIFLNFVNFYRKFIHRYLKIIEFLINLFKNNKIEKKSNFFEWFESTKLIYRYFRDIFTFTSFFCYYNSKKKMRIKIDFFNFVFVNIFNQQNDDENWRSITFMSRKIISIKQNYEIHDQKLLIIVQIFKIWKYYLKNNFETIEIWSNYNNFRKFIKQKKLNFKQVRWTLTLIIYNFEIFYQLNKINSTNESSKRFDYEKISLLNIRLLSTLQNKLTLSLLKNSITQNKRKMSINLISKSSIYTLNVVKIVRDETSS